MAETDISRSAKIGAVGSGVVGAIVGLIAYFILRGKPDVDWYTFIAGGALLASLVGAAIGGAFGEPVTRPEAMKTSAIGWGLLNGALTIFLTIQGGKSWLLSTGIVIGAAILGAVLGAVAGAIGFTVGPDD